MIKIQIKTQMGSLKAFVFLTLFVALFLSSCSTSIKLSEYGVHTLAKSPNMPSTNELENKTTKVLILTISNNKIDIASQANLGKSLASKINTNLAQAKSVSIVKRLSNDSYNKIISNEIKASELAKEVGSDVGQVDYIITGTISNATYDYQFKEGYFYKVKTKKGTKRLYQPPVIYYQACVAGYIKIFALPRLNEMKSISLDECSSTSHEARYPSDARKRNDSLVREAGEETISKASYPLKNFFAKKGYIYASKKRGGDMIVRTTLGSSSGAKQDEEVDIWSIEKYTNPLTKQTKMIEVQVAKGTISNQITSEYSWVIIDDILDDKSIHLGDYIKIKYEEGFFSAFGRSIN